MTLNTVQRVMAVSASAPSTLRLRMEPTDSIHTLLDGSWWPRSTDPVAELPGLVLAIDKLRGPVTQLVLSADGWDEHPRRLHVAERVLRLGYFASQPTALLTALCDNGKRVDLLVVPPDTEPGLADAAMVIAAATSNLIHIQHIFADAGRGRITTPMSGLASGRATMTVHPLRAIPSAPGTAPGRASGHRTGTSEA
jgi:uncharacterized protein DUF5994